MEVPPTRSLTKGERLGDRKSREGTILGPKKNIIETQMPIPATAVVEAIIASVKGGQTQILALPYGSAG